MATIAYNPIVNGLSGMLGKTLVFKNYRNKTVVAAYTKPSKMQSAQQQANHSKFRDASLWAKVTLKDLERKAYYQAKAKKLGLPNAYTAAITDYMRKPQVTQFKNSGDTASYCVYKKDFAIKKVEVQITSVDSATRTILIDANKMGECVFQLNRSEFSEQPLVVTNAFDKKELVPWH